MAVNRCFWMQNAFPDIMIKCHSHCQKMDIILKALKIGFLS